jgi:glycosyltransferase involved in cell wall biosynthesis
MNNQRLNLLHIIRSLDPRDGGIVGMTRDLVLAAAQRGDRAAVATLDAPGSPWLDQWPGKTYALGPARGTYGYTPRLKSWLRVHAGFYDGIVLHGLWQYTTFGSWLALADNPCVTPHVVFPHGMLDRWFRDGEPLKFVKKSLYWLLEYQALRSARAVCFTAAEERRNARETFRPYDCRETVVGAGIHPAPATPDSQAAAFLTEFPALAGRRFILFLGRIHPKKGCDLLVRAFARIAPQRPDLHLVIAGPDPLDWEDELREMLPGTLESRLLFTGMLEGNRKWAALRAADAFIIPSHQENFCLAAAEALACGTPVLLSDKVNIWSEVTTDRAGFVQPDTIDGTFRLLKQWENTSLEVKGQMRDRARNCFSKHFSIDRVYGKLRSLFNPSPTEP